MLRQKARPYLFSNTLAPPVAAASLEAFDLLQESTALRDTLEHNTKYFRHAMTEVGSTSNLFDQHPSSSSSYLTTIPSYGKASQALQQLD